MDAGDVYRPHGGRRVHVIAAEAPGLRRLAQHWNDLSFYALAISLRRSIQLDLKTKSRDPADKKPRNARIRFPTQIAQVASRE